MTPPTATPSPDTQKPKDLKIRPRYLPGTIYVILLLGAIWLIARGNSVVQVALLWALVATCAFRLVRLGYEAQWTGFGAYVGPKSQPDQDTQRSKTLWDWLQLLFVPTTLLIAGIWFTALLQKQANDATNRETTGLAAQQARQQESQAQDATLSTYLDRMSDLLTTDHLAYKGNASTAALARARTLTTLLSLDAAHKGILLKFLYEGQMISKPMPKVDVRAADFSGVAVSDTELYNADLAHANLDHANLAGSDLQGATFSLGSARGIDARGTSFWYADLSAVDLEGANLSHAIFEGAFLSGTSFHKANISYANFQDDMAHADDFTGSYAENVDFSFSDLKYANFSNANLRGANFTKTNLSEAILTHADLSQANLSHANLYHANISGAILTGADLHGTKMPNGSTHK